MSMDDQAAVHEAIDNHRYNPEILPNLEAYIDYQIANSTYDFEANLAILKLYQFYPQNTNMEVVAKILAKALMSIPSTDFLLCTYLISEQIKVDAAVEALYQLSNMLEQAEFKQFWQTYTDCAASPLLASIPDFEEKICEFAIGLLTASHQTLDKSVVATLLNKTLGECQQLIVAKGWEHDEHTVTFPLTAANQAQLKTTSGQSLQFSQLRSVLGSLS